MVFSQPSLPVWMAVIGTEEEDTCWPHLKGIHVPRIEAKLAYW